MRRKHGRYLTALLGGGVDMQLQMVVCGDIVPTEYTRAAFETGDTKALMGNALCVIKSADFSIANLECALTDGGRPIRKLGPNLKGRSAYAKVIADCGFTHLCMSNNHVMDFGRESMRETARAISEAGMKPFGLGENDQDSRKAAYMEKNGLKVAVIGVCEHEYSYALPKRFGANPFDPFDTMQDIADARAHADKVIVMYHGGKEQCQYPSPRLRKACRAMVRAGADLVLCQHSHCVGCREHYMQGEIVYGTGNFNFVTNLEHPHWRNGLMVRMTLGDDVDIEYLPVVPTDSGITLADGAQRREILEGFAERSAILQDDERWNREWRSFCDSVAAGYKAAAAKCDEQVFPHYLDCEAHLDVWKTIFETWHRASNE